MGFSWLIANSSQQSAGQSVVSLWAELDPSFSTELLQKLWPALNYLTPNMLSAIKLAIATGLDYIRWCIFPFSLSFFISIPKSYITILGTFKKASTVTSTIGKILAGWGKFLKNRVILRNNLKEKLEDKAGLCLKILWRKMLEGSL